MSNSVEFSAVIPVFNSDQIVGETVRRTCEFFESKSLTYEIVLVNDGSSDNSWEVIKSLAIENEKIVAINLLRNSGQHNANICGFRNASGRWVITLDDDLQNPPEEIEWLIQKSKEGHDLVIGQFYEKQHANYRKLGTRIVGALNRKIFKSPPDLILSNFRLIRHDVIDRICNYSGPTPYVPGLCLLYSGNPANVKVKHDPRKVGKSNYTLSRIVRLVSTILFNYSSLPLQVVTGIGIMISIASFIIGLYYLAIGLFSSIQVPGWTTLTVMLGFFNGVIMLMLGMLGEYTVRVITQISMSDAYFIAEIVRRNA